MKKIISTILTIFALSLTNSVAQIDCTQFKKISAKYLECTSKKLVEKKDRQKEKFDKSDLKKKLIKFKNSKSLTNFVEKE